MSLWESGEIITKDKLNLKTIYIGSSPPPNPVNGMVWVDTSSTPFLVKIYHGGFWDVARGASTDRVTAPPASTSDYLTPSSVSASSQVNHSYNNNATGYTVNHLSWSPNLKTSFYAAGRYWVFYARAGSPGGIYYTSSADLSTWASEACAVADLYDERDWDLWFDGAYVHLVYVKSSPAPDYSLYYVRAQPNSDGSITWGSPQVIVSATVYTYRRPRIAVDDYGYASVVAEQAAYYIKVWRNTLNNGSWSGVEYTLYAGSNGGRGALTPLGGSSMLAVYAKYADQSLVSRTWDGSNWGGEVSVGTVYRFDSYEYEFSTPFTDPYDGVPHVLFRDTSNNLRDMKLQAGSWSVNAIFGTSPSAGTWAFVKCNRELALIWWGYNGQVNYYLWIRRLLDSTWANKINLGFADLYPQKVYAGAPSERFTYSYTYASASPYSVLLGYFKPGYPAEDTLDDKSQSGWKPDPPNQPNAWIQFQLFSTPIGGVAGCRIYWPSEATLRPQAYRIQVSEDGSNWQTLATYTQPPEAGWREYSWPPLSSCKYIRITIDTTGTSGVTLQEFDYYQSSIWRHGHRGD